MCRACLVVLSVGDKKAAAPFPDGSGHNSHDPYWATVSEVRELHMPASERSCVHVELDISGNTQLTYQTGEGAHTHSVVKATVG